MKLNKKIFILLILINFISSCGLIPTRGIIIEEDTFSTKSLDDSSIKVLDWNIHKEGNSRDWVEDYDKIYEDKKPDIIVFQEARLNTGLKQALKTGKEMGWIFSPNIEERNHDTYSGVLTASKAKPSEQCSITTEGLEPIFKTPKTSLITTYKLSPSNKLLMVVNIHGINMANLENFEAQLLKIVNKVSEHNGPIIFVGDFNTRNKERLNFLLRELKDKLDLEAVPFTKKDKKEIKHFIFSPIPLDHIFYSSKELEVKQDSPDVLETFKSSDHKPLFVEFNVRE
ncbi:MAG: endonuclease/exonuclease/phosphatase family protein [Planctomycetota bacterium]